MGTGRARRNNKQQPGLDGVGLHPFLFLCISHLHQFLFPLFPHVAKLWFTVLAIFLPFLIGYYIWKQFFRHWFKYRPDDGSNKFLWNVCQYLLDHTVQLPRRKPSLFTNFDSIFTFLLTCLQLILVWSVCPIVLGWDSLSRPYFVISAKSGNLRFFVNKMTRDTFASILEIAHFSPQLSLNFLSSRLCWKFLTASNMKRWLISWLK
jgi:hypothetical protein